MLDICFTVGDTSVYCTCLLAHAPHAIVLKIRNVSHTLKSLITAKQSSFSFRSLAPDNVNSTKVLISSWKEYVFNLKFRRKKNV